MWPHPTSSALARPVGGSAIVKVAWMLMSRPMRGTWQQVTAAKPRIARRCFVSTMSTASATVRQGQAGAQKLRGCWRAFLSVPNTAIRSVSTRAGCALLGTARRAYPSTRRHLISAVG